MPAEVQLTAGDGKAVWSPGSRGLLLPLLAAYAAGAPTYVEDLAAYIARQARGYGEVRLDGSFPAYRDMALAPAD